MPDSQSASEQGGSAPARKALRTRLASSGGQLTQRSERDAGRAARLGRLLSGTRLWSGGEKPAGFSRIPRRELSGNARPAKAATRSTQRAQPLLPALTAFAAPESRAGSCRARGGGRSRQATFLPKRCACCRLPCRSVSLSCPPRSRPSHPLKGRPPEPDCQDSRRVQGGRFFESVRLLGRGK